MDKVMAKMKVATLVVKMVAVLVLPRADLMAVQLVVEWVAWSVV